MCRPVHMLIILGLSNLLLETREYRQTAGLIQEHSQHLHHPHIQTALATALLHTGDVENALKWFASAFTARPTDTAIFQSYHSALTTSGLFRKALNVARQVTQATPDRSVGHVAMGESLLSLGRHEEAAVVLDVAVSTDPTDWQAWYHLGRVRSALGTLTEACVAFEEADRLTDSAVMTYDMGRAYLALAGLNSALGEELRGRGGGGAAASRPLLLKAYRALLRAVQHCGGCSEAWLALGECVHVC